MNTTLRTFADKVSPNTVAASRAAAVAATLVLGACASLQPTQSGFLADYKSLHPSADHRQGAVFREPGLDTQRYSAFLLEPVAFKPIRPMQDLDQATIDELKGDFQQKLRSAFAQHLQETATPGPGVMVIRAAVTDIGRANPILNAVTMAAVLVPVTAGGASTEAEVIDGVSGEQLVALQAVTNGGRSFLGGPIGYLSKYGHARRAFAKQADQLAQEVFNAGTGPGQQPRVAATL